MHRKLVGPQQFQIQALRWHQNIFEDVVVQHADFLFAIKSPEARHLTENKIYMMKAMVK